ncbi:MAG: ROK family protein [Tetrasphaera sp.]
MSTAYLLGVEIGGTKLQVALGTPDGRIVELAQGRVDRGRGPAGILEWLAANAAALNARAGEHGGDVCGIGVGFGGPLETVGGRIIESVQIPDWEGFELGHWFEDHFDLPTQVYNDSSAAGYGEYRLGSGRGTSEFFYTNIGSGIGGSLIVDGRLYDGQGVGAAEFGQTRIPDWTSSRPGADIKLEALCSGWGIEQRLRAPGYVPADSAVLDLAGGAIERITCSALGAAAAGGDAFALAELDAVARGFGTALASLLVMFQPERIAIGGGVALIGEPLLEPIRRHTAERAFISNLGRYDIVACELGEGVVLHGALLLAPHTTAAA